MQGSVEKNSQGPYAASAFDVLERLRALFEPTAHDCAEMICQELRTLSGGTEYFDRIGPEESENIKQKLTLYMVGILAPGLTESEHAALSAEAGRDHALSGLDVLRLVRSYGLYKRHLFRLINSTHFDWQARGLLAGVISLRVHRDLEGQIGAYREIELSVTTAMTAIDRHALASENLSDLIRGTMKIIGSLPGAPRLVFSRIDSFGILQVEATSNKDTDRLMRMFSTGQVSQISVDPDQPSGRGPAGRAWRSGQIVVCDSYDTDPLTAPWRQLSRDENIRSSLAMPLLDQNGNTTALLSMYSNWSGYFSIPYIRGFIAHVAHVLQYAARRFAHAEVIPRHLQHVYREMLRHGRVAVLYQPILRLGDGGLAALEALARLEEEDGQLISPQQFLPAFGTAELLELFHQVLEQVCLVLNAPETAHLAPYISVNYPAEGVGDPRYEALLFDILARHRVPSDRINLEILESQEFAVASESRQTFFERLKRKGVHISQDDLGSGHSSLLRMEELAFDGVKIDQHLMRNIDKNRRRGLSFILHLSRLAHDCDIPVTVEGLEDICMIEAAAILGVDQGQGYGIAKPMPAAALPGWLRGYSYPINREHPSTEMGLLAAELVKCPAR